MFSLFLFLWSFLLAAGQDYDEVAEFQELLKEENTILVLFTKKCCTCTECVEAEVRLGGMSKNLESMNILVARLRKAVFRKTYGIKTLPSVVFIRKGIPALYDGRLEVERLFWWLTDNSEPVTKELDDSSFEHLTQAATGATTGDWLVAFYNKSCIDKNALYTHLECVASHLKSRVNVAIVDGAEAPETIDRFRISRCPEVIFFRHGKMYRTEWSDATDLHAFVERLYKEHKAEVVPLPLTFFDKLVDGCVDALKHHTKTVAVALTLILGLTAAILLLTSKKSKPKSN